MPVDRPFSAYRGSAPFIFVSYSHADEKRVFEELIRLHEAGFPVWYDEGITPGSRWSDELAERIDACRLFLIFVTPRSAESPHCLRELNYAQNRGVDVLTVHLEETRLAPGLELALSDRQAILKYRLPAAGYTDKLLAAVAARISAEETPGDLPPAKRRGHLTGTTMALAGALLLVVAVIASSVYVYLGDKPVVADDPEKKWLQDAPATPRVAVMQIRNLTSNPDGEWLAGGLTEELRREMGNWERFEVLPGVLTRDRTLEELAPKADIVVDGFLTNDGEGVAVVVDVVLTGSDAPPIEQKVSAPWGEPGQLQKTLAANLAVLFDRSVASNANLVPSQAAWPEYLRYLHEGMWGDFETMTYRLERTLEKDQAWSYGWGWLAMYRAQQYNHLSDPAYLAMADQALANAATSGNELWWRWSWAHVQGYLRGDLQTLLDVAAMYFDGGSAQPYLQLMMQAGLNEEVREPLRRLAEGSGRNLFEAFRFQAINETVLGDRRRAEAATERMLQLAPPSSYQALGAAMVQAAGSGNIDAAERYLAELHRLTGEVEPGSESYRSRRVYEMFAVAMIAAVRGNVSELEPAIDFFLEQGPHFDVVFFLLLAGEEERAWALYPEAREAPLPRWGQFNTLALTPPSLRQHPLIKRMNDDMGYTDAFQLAVCLSVNQRPEHWGMHCDPARYDKQADSSRE